MSNYWDDLLEDDDHAATYMDTYGEGPDFETRFFIGSFVNEGESVLDVGAGPAWNYEHFKKHGPNVIYKAYDYSERFVRTANNRIGAEIVHLGDVRKITEEDLSWDVVVMQDVLEHTNGYEEPIREALRVAKKRVIISFWHLIEDQDAEHINDDGKDGWGAWYARPNLEKFLNSLDYVWFDAEISPEGKNHPWNFFIIDKELK